MHLEACRWHVCCLCLPVGCKNCANTAEDTFAIEDLWGRARVCNQHGNSPDKIQEAIDTWYGLIMPPEAYTRCTGSPAALFLWSLLSRDSAACICSLAPFWGDPTVQSRSLNLPPLLPLICLILYLCLPLFGPTALCRASTG